MLRDFVNKLHNIIKQAQIEVFNTDLNTKLIACYENLFCYFSASSLPSSKQQYTILTIIFLFNFNVTSQLQEKNYIYNYVNYIYYY